MKKKNKKFVKSVCSITLFLFLIFMTIYIFEQTGYYEYELHKQTTLTNEAIERFERDVASGKDVRVEDYLESKTQNYNNLFSNIGYSISTYLGDTTRDILKVTFEILGKWLDA